MCFGYCSTCSILWKSKAETTHPKISLIRHWQRGFGRDIKLKSETGLKNILDGHLKEYRNKVQKGCGLKRSNLIKWKENHHILLNILNKEVNIENFAQREKDFFNDQVTLTRKIKIDNLHVDEEHEAMLVEIENEESKMELSLPEDEETVMVMNSTFLDDSNISFAVNRSGKIRPTPSSTEIGVQTDLTFNLRDGSKKFNDSIKIALAASSSAANISPEAARLAYKVATERHLGLSYKLESHISNDEANPPKKKRPYTKNEYMEYRDVLPSAKTIRKMKHLMAIQEERNAALAVLDTVPSDVVTFHYDTTKRKRLNGEWPSLVLQFSNGRKFCLRSLNMAIECSSHVQQLLMIILLLV